MHISDFDYELPPELIAREPARPRDASRMMVLDRRPADDAIRVSQIARVPANRPTSSFLMIRVSSARASTARLERANGGTTGIEVLFAAPGG